MAARKFRCTAGATGYDVFVGAGLLDSLAQDLRHGGPLGVSESTSVVVVTDQNAWHFHGARLVQRLRDAGLQPLVKILPPGEGTKTRKTKEDIEDWMLSNRCLRDTLLIAVGGGVVGDLVGYVASTYMRGVPVVQVPTTLLAMVDSSVGGKTGLDTPAGKNLIGAFHQPRAVYADTDVLCTLPLREISNGLAEVLKTGIIADEDLFGLLEEHGEAVLGEAVAGAYGLPYPPSGHGQEAGALSHIVVPAGTSAGQVAPAPEAVPLTARSLPTALITDIIGRSVAVKTRVVSGDEKEGGERAILNFGHTVGHGIEAILQPAWLHGECVSVGMVKELELARALRVRGVDSALVARLKRVAKSLGLPVTLPPSCSSGPGLAAALGHMGVDKKNSRSSSNNAGSGGKAGNDCSPGPALLAGSVKVVLVNGVGTVLAPPYAHAVPMRLVARVMSQAVTVVPGPYKAPGLAAVDSGAAASADASTGDRTVRIRVPGSKSISNRALLLAGLAQGRTVIRGLLASDDTQVMLACLGAMGAAAKAVPDPLDPTAPPCVEVTGTGGRFTLPPLDTSAPGGRKTLYVQNAGTASRFLASTAALLPLGQLDSSAGQAVVLAGNSRMAVRPIGPLVDALRAQGAAIAYTGKDGCPPLSFTRGIDRACDSVTAGVVPARPDGHAPGCAFRRRVVHLQAKLSSQYVSSILLAAPYFPAVLVDGAQAGSTDAADPGPVDPTNPAAWVEVVLAEDNPTSLPYITMTCAAMADFGVNVTRLAANRYLVPRHAYVAPPGGLYDVEPDASSASYPAAWGVLTGTTVVLEGIGKRSTQGDAGFPALLGRMGARVEQDDSRTVISGPSTGLAGLVGIEVDMADQTDCFMTLAAVAAVARGTTRIRGIANQRVKECNRIAAMVSELGKLGIRAWELPDGIGIQGTGGPEGGQAHGAVVHCYDDHRIAMSLSCLGCVVPGIVLDDAACVDKTFPEWWDVLEGKLGTRVEGADVGGQHEVKAIDNSTGGECTGPNAPARPLPVHTLVLIGMRGAGKSSLARAAASSLGHNWSCTDLDHVLEAREGKSCSSIVAAQGWEAFRALELAVLKDTQAAVPAPGTGRVLACGGGVVETEACRTALTAAGTGTVVIHIDRSVRDIETDIGKAVQAGQDAGRPAYAGGASLAETAARRAPLYAQCASATFTILPGERDWRAVDARFTRLVQQLTRPLTVPALVPRAAAAGHGAIGSSGILMDGTVPGVHPAATSFVCLALPDVRDVVPGAAAAGVGPGSGQAWDDVATALHTLASDADAVELRVDCLASYTDPSVVAYQLGLLRAGQARGAALALTKGAGGSDAAGNRVLPAISPKPIIYTVRSAGEGGKFSLSSGQDGESAMASVVRLGIRLGAEWVDIESGRAGAGGVLTPATALALAAEARAAGCRVVGSAHWPQQPAPTPGQLVAAARQAWRGGLGCDVVKLVTAATDVGQALAMQGAVAQVKEALAEAGQALAPPALAPPLIALAMGPAGALTRALNDTWTPVTHPGLPVKAAPGQLSTAQCRALRTSLGVLPPQAYFLFGQPVGQSLSPGLHNAGFRALGLPHRYGLVETTDAGYVNDIVRGRAAPATCAPYEGQADSSAWCPSAFPGLVAGGSVTMPLKQSIMPHCDSLGQAASVIGAVNVLTVHRQADGSLHVRGDNTDWVGVAQPVREALGRRARAQAQGKDDAPTNGRDTLLIVGAGGTSLAVAYAARVLGLRVVVANRSPDRACETVDRLVKGGQQDALAVGLEPAQLTPEALAAAGVGRVVAIVCTLPPSAAWTAPPSLLQAYRPVVLDVAYRPRLTPLLAQTRQEGCEAIEGVQMLIGQGLAAFAIWTGKESSVGAPLAAENRQPGTWGPGVPVPEMAAAVYKLLEDLPELK